MKRLLAYLFLVLGLGLTFSVEVNAEEKLYLKCVHKNLKLLEKSFYSNSGVGIYPKKLPSNFVKVILKVDKDLIRFVKKIPQNERNTQITELLGLIQKDLRTLERGFYSLDIEKARKLLIDKPINETDCNKTQIAKKEPSQTQEVAKLNNSDIINTAWILDSRYFVLFLKNEKCKFNDKGLDSIIRNLNYEGSWGISCKYKLYSNNRVELEHDLFNYPVKLYLAFSNNTFVGSIGSGFQGLEKILSGKKQPNVKGVKKELTPLQIAKLPKKEPTGIWKIEPSQTQEVAEKPKLAKDEVYYNLNFCTSSHIKDPLNEIKSVSIYSVILR